MSNSRSPLASVLSSSSLTGPRLLLILFRRQWPTLAQSRPRLATSNIGPASLEVSETIVIINNKSKVLDTPVRS